jgi:hypothetical protein
MKLICAIGAITDICENIAPGQHIAESHNAQRDYRPERFADVGGESQVA